MSLITNITTRAILSVDGNWTLSEFPTFVDEIIIRQITYTSTDLGRLIYLIRSDINQQVFGAVLNAEAFLSCPGTVIRVKNLQSTITFQLTQIGGSTLVTAGDQISISMDFVKHL